MTTLTTSLPDDLLLLLSEKAAQLTLPKNKLIEKALRIYLDHLNRAEYRKSYIEAASDADLIGMAEEGMEDYLRQLPDETA